MSRKIFQTDYPERGAYDGKALGLRMKTLRLALQKKVTQRVFARAVGVTQSAWSKYERNGGGMPSAELIARIVSYTQCSARWLLTGEGEPFATDPEGLTLAETRTEYYTPQQKAAALMRQSARLATEAAQLLEQEGKP